MGKEFYSPAEIAGALGVSVTTVKRWVDAGVLPAHKTVGGHRKILLADVLRIGREGNFPSLNLGRLHPGRRLDEPDTARLAQRLFDALREGDSANPLRDSWRVRGGRRPRGPGRRRGGAGDVPSWTRMGARSHRCNARTPEHAPLHGGAARAEAGTGSDRGTGRPVAVGGNPEGDHSLLASLLVQMVLLDAGWEAVNLGPHTPLASLRLALRELRPRMIWLSASYLPDLQSFLPEYRALYREAEAAGVAVVIGGQATHGSWRTQLPYTLHGETLADLAVFARTLHPRPWPPKRGRPAK